MRTVPIRASMVYPFGPVLECNFLALVGGGISPSPLLFLDRFEEGDGEGSCHFVLNKRLPADDPFNALCNEGLAELER